MSDGDAGGGDDGVGEMEALALVGDETRARILQALGDATVEREGLPRLSYTELREATGIRDSGRFNYHLSKLEGWWVRKFGDGYKLNGPGQQVYDALVAGSFTADATPESVKLDDRCPYCRRRLTALYTTHDVRLLVVCDWCGMGALNVQFPPNALETYEEPAAFVDAGARHSAMETRQMVVGQCYSCTAPVEAALHDRDPTERLPWGRDLRPLDVYATFHCQECTGFHYTTAGEVASYHPDVVGFCADRGVNVAATRKWRHDWLITDTHTVVVSTEPVRVTVDVSVPAAEDATGDGEPQPDEGGGVDVLRVTVDEDAAVVATEEL